MASKLAFTLTSSRPFNPLIQRPYVSTSSFHSSTRVQLFQFNGRQLSFRRRLLVLPVRATADQQGKVEKDETVDSNIDQKPKKSLGEMEQEFLQALQTFYYEGKAIMSNEEFDNLKEELMWEGSSVVMLSSDEQKFLEASMAYVAGTPILNDKEYDKLKVKLKMEGSEIIAEGPRCSLRSRKVYSDLSVDYLKMFLLNVPATVIAIGLFFFLDDLTGFEISYLLELPEPFSFIFTWFAALPVIVWLALSLTNAIVKDFLILKLGGKRIGIIGLGNIGAGVARRLEPFGCSIAYNSRKKKPSVSYPYYDNVHDLALSSDVLIVCCALSDETLHMINRDVLKALGKEGVVINVGRGSLVDEKELVKFLMEGELGGAGLEVFENEPVVPHELFALDSVVLSPHCAVMVPESFQAVSELVMDNLTAFFSNKPLKSLVNFE